MLCDGGMLVELPAPLHVKRPTISVNANSKRSQKANGFTKDIMVINQSKNDCFLHFLLPLNFVFIVFW